MTFEEIYKQIEDVEGWMGKSDCKALYTFAKDVKGLIVEIGSYMGRSTKLLALSSPQSVVIAIDPYKNNAYFPYDGEVIRDRFLENVKGLNVSLIQKPTSVAGKEWTLPIDLLHIDGDHLYEQVKEDIELFTPYVKKGSVVMLHDYNVQGKYDDYNPNFHGVYKALEEVKDTYFDEVVHDIEHYGFAICRKK